MTNGGAPDREAEMTNRIAAPEADDAAPSAAEVRAELARIIADAAFDAPDRNRRFLAHIVEEALAGRGDRIKAYGIAVSVFNRDDSFDPQTDPIVRIEASRLRRSLERYYLLAGRDDAIRIDIPKGGYAPSFYRQTGGGAQAASPPAAAPLPAAPAAQAPALATTIPAVRMMVLAGALVAALALGWTALAVAWLDRSGAASNGVSEFQVVRHGPAILVAPFDDDGGLEAHPRLAVGFTREIIAALTLFDDLFVFGSATTFRNASATDARATATELGVDFILEGGLAASADRLSVTATLVEVASGRHRWSGRFDATLAADRLIGVRDELANEVARALAERQGAVFAAKAAELQGKLPGSYSSYECVLLFYDYVRSYELALYQPVRECLERAIMVDPDYAGAHSALALVYTDAARFAARRGTVDFDPLTRALELANRAVELAPRASQGYRALHLVYWMMNDVERGLQAAERALELNPNDSELMAELGVRLALRARWDEGLPLILGAYARNPDLPAHYRMPLFIHHYVNGRFEDALAEAKKVGAPTVVYDHVALALGYAAVGRTAEASAEIARVLEIDPHYGDHAIADLEQRNLHPDLIRAIVDGLDAAGLPVARSPPRESS
jgi:adenylate cyclase